jgi:hypothetical protein
MLRQSNGETAYLISTRTEFLRDLEMTGRALAGINALLMCHASMAGPVFDERLARYTSGGKIKAIQEDGPEFGVQFEDCSTVTLQLANPGASVAVRNKNNRVEYLG